MSRIAPVMLICPSQSIDGTFLYVGIQVRAAFTHSRVDPIICPRTCFILLRRDALDYRQVVISITFFARKKFNFVPTLALL